LSPAKKGQKWPLRKREKDIKYEIVQEIEKRL
jgi:hypothetical protein